jgi:hypothetical protein
MRNFTRLYLVDGGEGDPPNEPPPDNEPGGGQTQTGGDGPKEDGNEQG